MDDEPGREENRWEIIEQAAIEAEFETGRREESVEEARKSLLLRLVQISVGSVVLLSGLLLMVMPGPGMVVVAIGLAILAPEVPFARRLLERVQERIPRDDDGNLPVRAKVALGGSIAFAVILTGASLWWTFAR
ncbi:MAG: hypothetical protein KatS3mg008_0988 [Acidimicrobiales bacterium]|nr:MAG: hypothetical protein KatS3mg008_0988 [Acidimicrobiales bacterium]